MDAKKWTSANSQFMSLVETRSGLEFLIAPWLSASKTKDAILFRGKRRYLKNYASIAKIASYPDLAYDFVSALQFIYKFDMAIENNDYSLAFSMAARFGGILVELGVFDASGMNTGDLMARVARRKAASAKGGKATAKWNAQTEKWAREIFANEKRGKVSKDSAYRRTVARLKAEHGISISRSTLQRYLNPPTA